MNSRGIILRELALFFGILAGCFLLLSAYSAEGYHDAALDTVNNNLGFLDSDLNGQFEWGPERWGKTNVAIHFDKGLGSVNERLMASNSAGLLGGTRIPELIGSPQTVSGGGYTNFALLTNAIRGAFSKFETNVSAAYLDWVFNQGGTNAGDGDQWSIAIHNPVNNFVSYKLTLSSASLAGYNFSPIKSLLIAFEGVMFFFLMLQAMKEEMAQTMNQRQISGTMQSILGTNASVPSGVAYAVIVTASIATASVLVLGSPLVAVGGDLFYHYVFNPATAMKDQITAVSGGSPLFGWLTEIIPLWQTVGFALGYLAWKYFLLSPVFMAIRCLMLWMVR